MVITGKAWNQDKQWLALVGSLHGKPAVRAYDLSNDQPVTFLNWNGKSEFKGATATAVSWIPGSDRLLVGIQKPVEKLKFCCSIGTQVTRTSP